MEIFDIPTNFTKWGSFGMFLFPTGRHYVVTRREKCSTCCKIMSLELVFIYFQVIIEAIFDVDHFARLWLPIKTKYTPGLMLVNVFNEYFDKDL